MFELQSSQVEPEQIVGITIAIAIGMDISFRHLLVPLVIDGLAMSVGINNNQTATTYNVFLLT